jgi:tetratricopeptide (TPR) repeat protein
MGETYLQVQEYEKAIDMFDKAIEICPNSSNSWDHLGNCYRIVKKPDSAENAYRQALSFSPTRYDSRESLRELEGKPPIFSSFHSTDIAKLKKTPASAENYPEDEAVYVLDDAKRVVYPKGASEYMREIAVKAFNSRGVDAFKEFDVGFNSYTESLTIEKAVVIKAKDLSEVKADINKNKIVFKSFEAGDMMYVKWHVKNYYSGKLSDHFWDEINFNGYIPKKLVRYSLLVPKNMPFTYTMQYGDAKPVIDTLQEGLRYSWTMENLPSIKQEEDMPELSDIGTILHISSIPDWNYIVQWYTDIARDKTRSSFEIKEQVAELLNGKSNLSETDKIRTIYNFITDKIRYSSVSFRQSAYIPQRARDVLVHKLGDCKDVATLCIAMLKEIGIPAYHVLVNTRNEGTNQYVLPSIAFNHCIVGAETQSGMKYLDLTASNFSMESAPYMDQDAFALLIKPGVKEPFYLADSLFSPKNIARTSLVTVNADKSIFVDRSSTCAGAAAGYYRERFRDKGKKDIENEFMSIISNEFN